MLQICFLILSAMFKALVDTIAFHKGGIFHADQFFDINVKGWKVPYSKYYVNGFHIFNSLMILFFLFACECDPLINIWWISIIVKGTIFILSFNFFWNKIFN